LSKSASNQHCRGHRLSHMCSLWQALLEIKQPLMPVKSLVRH
jgi:hypothetical protein